MSNKIPYCERCDILFPSWKEFALHISTSDKPHKQSTRIFAAHFLADVKNVKEHKPRMPMSDELKQAVKECVREISGETKKGLVKCPQCRQLHSAEIEVEHLVDWAWREDGKLMILCGDCRREKHGTAIR